MNDYSAELTRLFSSSFHPPPPLLPPLTGKHVSHLESATDDDLDRLLSIVVDVENLFICVHREEDPDTKQASDQLFLCVKGRVKEGL